MALEKFEFMRKELSDQQEKAVEKKAPAEDAMRQLYLEKLAKPIEELRRDPDWVKELENFKKELTERSKPFQESFAAEPESVIVEKKPVKTENLKKEEISKEKAKKIIKFAEEFTEDLMFAAGGAKSFISEEDKRKFLNFYIKKIEKLNLAVNERAMYLAGAMEISKAPMTKEIIFALQENFNELGKSLKLLGVGIRDAIGLLKTEKNPEKFIKLKNKLTENLWNDIHGQLKNRPYLISPLIHQIEKDVKEEAEKSKIELPDLFHGKGGYGEGWGLWDHVPPQLK